MAHHGLGHGQVHGLRAVSRRALWASFLAVLVLGGISAFAVGFTVSIRQWVYSSPEGAFLAYALAWSQAIAVVAATLLAAAMLALAWFVRLKLIEPLDRLRAAIASAQDGDGIALWGCGRDDEIGALARAIERLRTERPILPPTPSAVETPASNAFARMVERMAATMKQWEAELGVMTRVNDGAQERIEAACRETAKAAKGAAEAAALVCQAAARVAERLEATRRPPPEKQSASQAAALPARDAQQPITLETLMNDLDALETEIRRREPVSDHEAVVLTSALVDAIDRLNGVAEHVGDASDRARDTAMRRAFLRPV